jgi:hypothetical protein
METDMDVRKDAIEENYRKSIAATEEIIHDLKASCKLFLDSERLGALKDPHLSIPGVKSINADKETMEKAAATFMCFYLAQKYKLVKEGK